MKNQVKRNDRADRIRWLKELREAIPKGSDQITARTLDIWSHRLVRIPMSVLVVVANILVERHTFFPALAEILQVSKEVSGRAGDREWKKRLEGWRTEALSRGEAAKLLDAINKKAGTALVPSRRSGGMSRLVKQPKEVEPLGADMTVEEWEARKSKLKEKAVGA